MQPSDREGETAHVSPRTPALANSSNVKLDTQKQALLCSANRGPPASCHVHRINRGIFEQQLQRERVLHEHLRLL